MAEAAASASAPSSTSSAMNWAVIVVCRRARATWNRVCALFASSLEEDVVQPADRLGDDLLHVDPHVQKLGEGAAARIGAIEPIEGVGREGLVIHLPLQALSRSPEGAGQIRERGGPLHPRVELPGYALDLLQRLAQRPGGLGALGQTAGQLLPPRDFREERGALQFLVRGDARLAQKLEDLSGAPAGRLVAIGAVEGILQRLGALVSRQSGLQELVDGGAEPDREITPLVQGRDSGEDVVFGAVRGQVPHVSGEGSAGFQRVPHRPEGASRHIGVADDAVRSADQLLAAVLRQLDEGPVRKADDAALVRRREKHLIHADFTRGTGEYVHIAHEIAPD